MSVRFPKTESRLLGTWKSSRAKTMEFWAFPKKSRIGPKRKAEYAKIYGKLEWRFTKSRMYLKYDDFQEVTRYRVVASDNNSTVVEWLEDITPESEPSLFSPSLLQIYFEGENAFRIVSGYNQEFFRRVHT